MVTRCAPFIHVFGPVIGAHLVIEPIFLAHCVLQDLISHDTAAEVRRTGMSRSNAEAVKLLLSVMNEDDARSAAPTAVFVDCLQKSIDKHNHELADRIDGLMNSPALSSSFWKILQDMQRTIATITPSRILPHTELLNEMDMDIIAAQERREGALYAAFNMLITLESRGQDWHDQFISACRLSGCDEVASCLERNLGYEGSTNHDASTNHAATATGFSEVTTAANEFAEPINGEMYERDAFVEDSSTYLRHHEDYDYTEYEVASNYHLAHRDFQDGEDQFEDSMDLTNGDLYGQFPDDVGGASNYLDISRQLPERIDPVGDDRGNLFGDLRPYQLELAEPAVRGYNTVLVAPTGTGKTHVAAHIIDTHFQRVSRRNAKVAFVAHTKVLVDQQGNKLEEILAGRGRTLKIVPITGESLKLPISDIAREADVLVLTAQILLNGLQEHEMGISDLTLIIFDECHNCQKGHPFNRIMDMYHRQKFGGTKLPQIVGMTASIGTGKAKSLEQATNHAFEVLANLDAAKLQTVKNVEDLERYQNIPEEICPEFVRPRERDYFKDNLEEIMKKLENQLVDELGPFEQEGYIGKVELVCNGARDSQIYENWVITLGNEYVKVSQASSSTQQQVIRSCLEHLLEYSRALCLNRDVRTKDALTYLEREFIKKTQRKGGCNRKLLKLFYDSLQELRRVSANALENPVLERLGQLIEMEFTRKPESRALLFAQTIQATIALKEWVDEAPRLQRLELNGGRLTGATDQTNAERNNTIRKFRSGEHKLLVVTNVVEQGMDVPECNLVFRLNYVPSDTGHIQVKGRNRAKEGRSYLIASSDNRNFRKREIGNQIRETLMSRVIGIIQEMSETEFLEQIRRHQPKENRGRRLSNSYDTSTEYLLHCVDCKAFGCSSRDVFLVKGTYRTVRDEAFMERIEVFEMGSPIVIKPNELAVGKIACKNCGKDWGGMIILDDENLVVITITGFAVTNLSTRQVDHYRKWKDVPFHSLNYGDQVYS